MKDHEKCCELKEPLLEQNEGKKNEVVRQSLMGRIIGLGQRGPERALGKFSEQEQFNSGETTEPYTVFEPNQDENGLPQPERREVEGLYDA